MRAYVKNPAPELLLSWQIGGRPWENFAHDAGAYAPVKAALRAEQQHLCCYCEARLGDDHIEHFCPRHGLHGNASLMFDYANLGCSCNGGTDRNRHCGHYKGQQYDPRQFVTPCTENSGKLFAYTVDGDIGSVPGLEAAEQARGTYMIRTLNLDCPRLANMRRSHARTLQDAIQGMIDADAVDQIDDLALAYLTPDKEGGLQPFFSLSRQLFGTRAEVVLGLLEG
jgi:uncharacterized protein (TIGR02646 family)